MIAIRLALFRLTLCGLTLLWLAGCASTPGGGTNTSGVPAVGSDVDLSSVPPAIPRDEPLSKYGNPESYTVFGKTYYPMKSAIDFVQIGGASWYGRKFHGQRTSSGETYDMYLMTAAHKTLPIPCYVRVTNLRNHKQVIVRVNDRGPFHGDRIIDLSYVAALKLGIVKSGTAPVMIETVTTADTGTSSSVASNAAAYAGGNDSALPDLAPLIPVAYDAADQPRNMPSAGPYLQVGAFANHNNARQLSDELQRMGFRDVTITPEMSGGETLYRVRIGPFTDGNRLHSTRQNLMSRGMPVIVVTDTVR